MSEPSQFEYIIEILNASADNLRKVADNLRKTAEAQNRTNEKIKELNKKLIALNDLMEQNKNENRQTNMKNLN